MQKSSLSLILTVVFLISGGFFNIAEAQTTGSSGGICPGLITDKLAHPMTALARPARLQAVTDPQFGTTIRRITDVKNDGRGANNVLKPVYSTVSAWNADESRLILYRTAGSGAGGHELFDGRTYEFIRKLDDIDPADLEQIYWDTTDADILYYVNRVTRQMIRYHVSTKVKDVKHDFSSICSTDLHGGTDPMFTSWDSKMIGLVCGNKIFSYNLATDTVNTQLTLATGNNAPQATPSGTRFFLNENDTKGTVRDANMNILLTLNILDSGTHASMSRLSNGRDTFNSVDFDDTLNGTLVQHDMVTGIKRVFVGPSTGYPYPPSGTHVTGMAFKRPGLVGVSVKGNLNGSGLLDSELLLVDTDPATNPSGEVCRIGHHRTASDDYWAEPHPVLSPSGTRLLFGSSWGNTGVIVDSYVVELPSYTGGSVTPPPPDTTAPSVPAGLTATAISSSQINLSWTASTDNVSIGGYRIYRNGVEISTTGNTTYSDTNLSPSTTYTYRVASYDGSNNTSAQSAAVSATTPAEVLPPLLTDSTVVENFSTVRSFADGTVFGACNLLTMETAGSPSLSNASGRYLQASSAQKTDGFIVRSANALPATYKVSVDIGGINFDLLDPVDEENGAYFISITNQAGAPQLNSWWHTNRKIMIDTDNNVWGSGGTHPIFFGYYTTSNADYFYNQSTSAWTNSWVSASNYQPDAWYTFEIEKNTTQYIYRAYNTITGALIRQATIPIASVRGSTSPDYFAIGDPHTNYYNGSMKIANIRITNTGCGTTTPPPSDTTAPSIPTGLSATVISSSQINLSWTASTDNVGVTGYNVYRNGIQIVSVANTSYNDTGLIASTAYSYTVSAYDAAGYSSVQSASASATTQAVSTDTTLPTIPTGLTATAVSSSQINLSWTASTDNVGVTGYDIYRGGTPLTTVIGTSYSNTGLTASTLYSYTVRAKDAAGNNSTQTASASATTLAATPSASTAYDFEGGTVPAVFDVTPSAPWVIATDQKHVGTYSIKSGNAGSGNSFSQLTLLANFEAGDVSFWRRYETELNYDKFIFLIDGVPQSGYPKSGSGTTWMQNAFTSTLTAGVHSLDWIYVKDGGSNSGGDAVWLDDIAVPNFTAISDKGESFESGIPSTWTNDATEIWSATNAAYRKKLGSNSARSYATIGSNGASTLQRTVTTSAGDMWFYYYISSEAGFDFLRFYIDGVEKTNVAASGDYDSTRAALNSGWIFRKYSVTAASHTFKWEYTTDEGTTLGNNAAFIEMAYFPVTSTTPPTTPAPTITLSASPTSVTSGSSSTLTWSSTNATSCTASGGWSGSKATSGSQAITNITANTTFTLACTRAGGTATQSAIVTVIAGADTTPPTTPAGLTATTVSTSQINLSWTASADPLVAGQTNTGVSGYRIYRSGVQIATSPTTSYSNTGLASGTTYSYTVASVDGATPANVSPQSGSVSATTQTVVVPDTTAPTVSLSAPAAGATVSGTITVSSTASDNIGVTGVQFKLDNANLGAEDMTSPYSISWNTTSATNGTHTLSAVARDAAGNTATAVSRTVTASNITPDTTKPTVTITAPTTLTTYTAPTGTIIVSGTATDNIGVTLVSWSNSAGGTGTMTGMASWSTTITLQSGTNVITVTGRDAAGNLGTDIITVTYTPIITDTQVPATPTNLSGTAVSTSQIDLSWSPSTDNTAVTGYKVFTNGTQVATTTTTSYSHTNLSPFTTYSYTISAYDVGGNTGALSGALSVTTQSPATTPPPSTGGGTTTTGGGGTSSGGSITTTSGGITSTGGSTTSGGTSSSGGTTSGTGSSGTTSAGGTTTTTTGGTTTTLPPLTGPFGIGQRSDQVKLLQQMLIKDGSLSGEATGYYGPLTQKAVETFQIKYNLVTGGTLSTTGFGLAGPGTRAKLNSLYAGSGGGMSTDREALLTSLRKQVADLMAILQTLIAKLAALKAAQGV